VGLYSVVRAARWIAINYPAGKYARVLDESQHWSREQMEEYRNAKLRKLVAHCYQNVPYYRTVMADNHIRVEDIRRAEDLAGWPILTKATIRNDTKQLMAKNISELSVTWTKTGGTTGEPLRVCKNKECAAWSAMCYERALGWAGKKVDEPRVLLFGGSLGIERTPLLTRIGNSLCRNLFIPAFELTADNADSYFQKIRCSNCRYIVGYASALYRLASLSKELGNKIRFVAALPTAELLLPEWEEMIRETFNCAVLPFYGCGEVNSLAFSTPESNGYLISEEHALVEVMDSNANTKLYGEGKFLISDLDNYAMPIIRYENGDAGRISESDGRLPFSRIERLDGRYNSLLLTESGNLISGVIATHVFRLVSSVKSYRVIQEQPLKITIKLVPKQERVSQNDERLVLRLFRKYLGNKMQITFEILPDLPTSPSGKSILVINRCLQ
jgi:phenylacetate-coenzyme A ligase PaaK-like adenylate-forming protein